MSQLSLDPYKGTRDFYPEDQFIQNHVFSTWKKVVESYGYLEYDSSILEETELYRAKSGEEIVNEQTYSFKDRGERDVTIRPEMTPTVARMVARKRKELAFPLRWYSIPNLWRYERPQKGRLREHWQLNVDIFGVESIEADIELVQIAADIMKAFGAEESQYEIRINSRKFLNYLLHEHFALTAEQAHKISKLLDRMQKMNAQEFDDAIREVIEDQGIAGALITTARAKSFEEFPGDVRAHETVTELMDFLETLRNRGIVNARFEMSVVRGFDYYTGMVFEVFDTNPVNPRSVFGGGRYDDLVSIFGVEKVTGAGFGAGDVTIADFLETYDLLPEYKSTVQLYIVPFDSPSLDFSSNLASRLRLQGLNVAVDLTDRKIAAKVKTADKEKIPWVVVIGDTEIQNKKFKLKNLSESVEYEVSEDEIIGTIYGKGK